MKQLPPALLLLVLLFHSRSGTSQQPNGKNVFDKANNGMNKISNAIAVFQPYLLKARQLYYDAKQTASDFKRDAKGVLYKDSTANSGYSSGGYSSSGDSQSGYNSSGASSNGTYNNNGNGSNSGSNGYGNNGSAGNSTYSSGAYSKSTANSPTPYLTGQSLPVNNPSSINGDGTGNWGNQNNGLYGNCIDVLTGTVMGMGEAAQSPGAVDLMFFAPTDGQNVYYLMTPGFARNNGTAGVMTQGVSDQVLQWSDVNESEVALTKLTLGQFNQIQNNSQIQNAARNAIDYTGWYSSGQKLDGQIFAVRVQGENRDVYALVAVIKQVGTSGSNGYLKIKIKSTGIDANHDGQPDANAYTR